MEAVRVLMPCNSFLKTPIKMLITGFRYVKLISSDGHEFMVARDHALTSGTIKVIASYTYYWIDTVSEVESGWRSNISCFRQCSLVPASLQRMRQMR